MAPLLNPPARAGVITIMNNRVLFTNINQCIRKNTGEGSPLDRQIKRNFSEIYPLLRNNSYRKKNYHQAMIIENLSIYHLIGKFALTSEYGGRHSLHNINTWIEGFNRVQANSAYGGDLMRRYEDTYKDYNDKPILCDTFRYDKDIVSVLTLIGCNIRLFDQVYKDALKVKYGEKWKKIYRGTLNK